MIAFKIVFYVGNTAQYVVACRYYLLMLFQSVLFSRNELTKETHLLVKSTTSTDAAAAEEAWRVVTAEEVLE